MDKSLVCNASSKLNDPYGELKIFSGRASGHLARAICADAIEAAGADRVLTMDLHSPQIQGFFKIPVDHLYAMPVLVDYFRKKQIPDLVVASPDVGFGKQAYRFAQLMQTNVVFCKGSAEKLARSPIKEMVLTDTIGYRFEPLAPCCKVISVANLFAEAIQS